MLAGEVRLRAADIDNNGAIDLLLAQVAPASGRIAGGLIWLADQKRTFNLLDTAVGTSEVFDLADIHSDGRLSLLGLTLDGQPQVELNHGTKNYHWQIIRPRARQATGDQRINSFGIGGEIEIRSGLLVQKQTIEGPQVHFGLGNQTGFFGKLLDALPLQVALRVILVGLALAVG